MSTEERPVFRPNNYRPPRDEIYEMKQAVIARDGLTDCFWCRTPFAGIEDATLEHIFPLADGGRNDLRNCTLACIKCNLRNEPRTLTKFKVEIELFKERRAAANRAANGGCVVEKCDAEVEKRFDSIDRSQRGKPLTYATASFLLKTMHRQMNRQPPSAHEKHLLRGHFNRWQNEKLRLIAAQSKLLQIAR